MRVSAHPPGWIGYQLSWLTGTHLLPECPFRCRPILNIVRTERGLSRKREFHSLALSVAARALLEARSFTML